MKEKILQNAIWFSRHNPSAEQLAEIAGEGNALVAIEEGIALGSRNINSEDDLDDVVRHIRALARKHSAWTIYGVFPVPVLGVMCSYVGVSYDDTPGRGLHCFSAWNVTRSNDGEKPSFSHKKFLFIGMLYAGSDE